MPNNLAQIERRIEEIKTKLCALGEMRPGSVTLQYKNPKEKWGAFYQISYTYKMRSKTEYVRPEFVKELREQTATFKKFKSLVQQWTDLALEHSKLKITLAKKAKK